MNTNNIRFQKVTRIRIRILVFGLKYSNNNRRPNYSLTSDLKPTVAESIDEKLMCFISPCIAPCTLSICRSHTFQRIWQDSRFAHDWGHLCGLQSTSKLWLSHQFLCQCLLSSFHNSRIPSCSLSHCRPPNP